MWTCRGEMCRWWFREEDGRGAEEVPRRWFKHYGDLTFTLEIVLWLTELVIDCWVVCSMERFLDLEQGMHHRVF
jgi:hypothetical protein